MSLVKCLFFISAQYTHYSNKRVKEGGGGREGRKEGGRDG
jgi:hypothetical protein